MPSTSRTAPTAVPAAAQAAKIAAAAVTPCAEPASSATAAPPTPAARRTAPPKQAPAATLQTPTSAHAVAGYGLKAGLRPPTEGRTGFACSARTAAPSTVPSTVCPTCAESLAKASTAYAGQANGAASPKTTAHSTPSTLQPAGVLCRAIAGIRGRARPAVSAAETSAQAGHSTATGRQSGTRSQPAA